MRLIKNTDIKGFMETWTKIFYGEAVDPGQLRGEMQAVDCYGLHSSSQVNEVKRKLEREWGFVNWANHASFEGFVRAMLFTAGHDKNPVVRFAKRSDKAGEKNEEDEMNEMESLVGRVVLALSACQREGVNVDD